MTWEYLQNDRLDERFRGTLKRLSGELRGARLVELNCGTARILPYLADVPIASYYGNEKLLELLPTVTDKRVTLECKLDAAVANNPPPCDILMCFGFSCRKPGDEPHESPTIVMSICQIAERVLPEFVVIEKARAWPHPDLQELITYLYHLDYTCWAAGSLPGPGLEHRTVRIFRRAT